MEDAERSHVAGTQLLLAEIEACRGDPEVTPEIRFLATCAMARPEILEHGDLHRLAAAMMRFAERRRSASSGAAWPFETGRVGGPERLSEARRPRFDGEQAGHARGPADPDDR